MSDRREPDLTKIIERIEFPHSYRMSFVVNTLVLPIYDDIKRDLDLNRGECVLLMCLAHYDELTAQDVVNMSRRPRNSISRSVHRMLKEGYLSRSQHPHDGRQVWLRITDKGRKLHQELIGAFVEREQEFFGVLSDKELGSLDKILTKLALHAAAD